MPRVRSTQKLPIRSVRSRARPRTTAIATASPTAADKKFCTVSPAACTRYPVPASPAYDCQFVLVTNETAVLRAVSTFIERPSDQGKKRWTTISSHSARIDTPENASTDSA